jgi:hypothetical protein
MMREAGFADAELVAETGFNSSPVTKGVLFRAVKPVIGVKPERDWSALEPAKMASAEQQVPEDAMEYLLRRALELGAEKAKIIDIRTVSVGEEWVRWKCQYGCPMYDKDAFHPPFAPDAESTKRVLRDYCRAILLNGPDGKSLTEVAVRLEGEAYQRGYYKAFALVALAPGPGTDCGAATPVASGGG